MKMKTGLKAGQPNVSINQQAGVAFGGGDVNINVPPAPPAGG
jgi:hypothetical protein